MACNYHLAQGMHNRSVSGTKCLTIHAIANQYKLPFDAAKKWLLAYWDEEHKGEDAPQLWPASIIQRPPRTELLVRILMPGAWQFVKAFMKDEERVNKVALALLAE